MKHSLAVAALFIIILSCKKSTDKGDNLQPITDSRDILLKEVAVERLPSPYFHFTYNDSNFITRIDFASMLFSWKVDYENNRVKRMVNTNNNDTLLYNYANRQVISIKHTNARTGKPLWTYNFSYDNYILKEIRYWNFPAAGVDSILSRKVTLAYYPDGNLERYDDYNSINSGEVTLTNSVKFTGYDQGINVDDFYLLKNFFDDLLFLPQVKFQKTNPAHVTMTGINNDYTIDYIYQYNTDKLPTQKSYTIIATRGSSAGQQFTGTDQFSY
jgi:hypothetical protein